MKTINRYKLTYYHIPCGDPIQIEEDILRKGEKAILKKLVYEGALSIIKSYNIVNEKCIKYICACYDLHYYQDKDSNKYLSTHIRYINGIKLLVKLDEDEYFDQIEMAAYDFHAKIEVTSAMDTIIDEFKALIKSDNLINDCEAFCSRHFSSENIKFEVRHERKGQYEGFEACQHLIFDIARVAHDNKACSEKIRFIGHQLRPYGIYIYDQEKGKQHFGIGISSQEENHKGLYICMENVPHEMVLFDLDENNKINHITLIRGSAVNLYNIISDDSEKDIWR